jgi:membrane fusion protein (multidrug efflux system)
MNKKMLIMLAACALVFGGIFGFKWFKSRLINHFFDTMPESAVTVSTTQARVQTWPLRLSAVGTVRAVKGTEVTTQVAGIVDSIRFDSGGAAKSGQILLTLDRRVDQAQLEALQAQAKLADVQLERDRKLFAQKAISQSQLDQSNAQAAAAQANAAAQQARVDQKVIRAPFAGEIGIRKVDLGDHLDPGTAIVSLQSLDPIYVDFKLPQQRLGAVRTGLPVAAHVDLGGEADSGASGDVRDDRGAGNDGELAPGTADGGSGASRGAGEEGGGGDRGERWLMGHLSAIDPLVETSTRNFQAQATFANPDHVLRPGMFARIEIDLGRDEDVIAVPQTAISFNPYGDSVWVIGSGKDGKRTAERRIVKTGRRRGDLVQVVAGLKAGEQVATSGLLKLRNGVPVDVDNQVQPPAQAAPEPPNG